MEAFLRRRYKTAKEALAKDFNPEFWRHGLVISQGNGLSVSYARAKRRLLIIAKRLLRRIFGNHWRDKAKLTFLVCQQGSRKSFNVHFHVLVGIEGEHDWTDQRIAEEIARVDSEIAFKGEKPIHIDYDWEKSNRYHWYVTRECYNNPDSYFVL